MDVTVPAIVWIPAGVVLGALVVGLIAEAVGRRAFGIALVAIGLLAAAGINGWVALSTSPVRAFSGHLLLGGGFAGLACFIDLLAGLSVLSGWERSQSTPRGGVVAGLTALVAVAAQVLASAGDLLTAVLVLEAIALAGYALLSSAGTRRSDEAAMRYFVQGGTATAFTVLGLGVLFGLYGTTDYVTLIGVVAGDSATVAFAMVLLLAAFAFKLGAVPFHSWAPDVYENADSSVAGMLASVPKIGALMAMLILFPGGPLSSDLLPGARLALVTVATASVVVGNLGALRQRSLGRMLGYSGIAQVGYGLIGVASGLGALMAAAVFAITYAIGAAAAFFIAEAIRARRPEWDGTIAGLAGLSAESPSLAAAMTIAVLSLTGIPLMVGFWGKLLVFLAAVSGGLTWLAVVGVIGSVISFGYYGAVIRAMYSPAETLADDTVSNVAAGGRTSIVVALVTSALVLTGGVLPLVAGIDILYKLLRF